MGWSFTIFNLLAVLTAVLAWGAGTVQAGTLSITAFTSTAWVYQNTPNLTQYRHWRPLTVNVTSNTYGNTSYTLTLSQSGPGAVTVMTTPKYGFTGPTMVLPLVGGPRQSDFVTGTGSCTIQVTVSGNVGGQAQVSVPFAVRRLGDINADGLVTAADRDALNARLNGLPTGLADDAFDLIGEGSVTAADRVVLNKILNGLLNDQSVYAQWSNGLSPSPSYFPIGVWLQSSWNAARYKAAGFNLYIGYWGDPAASDLATLRSAGMQLICAQDAASLSLSSSYPGVIVGWLQVDEPDNAQSDGHGGYGPPILPSVIVGDYQSFRAADPTRPVFLGCGRGVANFYWVGRGTGYGPQDYPFWTTSANPVGGYYAGSDIASYDIYPFNSTDQSANSPWYVAFGVDNLVAWTNSRTQTVWNDLECTSINGSLGPTGPTPAQTRAEIWMSLIHGSHGLVLFCHQWHPFCEYELLQEPAMLAMVTASNQQIQQLAPVLNCPSVAVSLSPLSVPSGSYPVDYMVKQYAGSTWLFAVEMRNGSAAPTFTVPGLKQPATAVVLGESRSLPVTASGGVFQFQDSFGPYAVHLYQITPNSP